MPCPSDAYEGSIFQKPDETQAAFGFSSSGRVADVDETHTRS